MEENLQARNPSKDFRKGEDAKYGNIEGDVFRDSEVKRKISPHHKTLGRQNLHI